MGKRVLLISASDPAVLGGQELQTLQIMSGLSEDYEFVLVCGEGPFAQRARQVGGRVFVLPLRQRNLLRSVAQVRHLIRDQRIDIVHTLEIRGNLIGRLATRFSRPRPKVVSTRHELIFSPYFTSTARLKRRAYLLLERLTARYTDLFVTVSQATANEIIRFAAVHPSKVRVIHNGVDTHAIEAAAAAAAPPIAAEADVVVGWVGRLVADKGLMDLISVAEGLIHGDVRIAFVVVGDGPSRQLFEEEVSSLRLGEYFHFLGYQSNVYPVLRLFDLLVLTSRHESLPLILIEAMALSKPVVATAVGGVPELVEDGESGILVSPAKPSEIGLAIERLLSDAALRARMGARGREIVDHNFTLERMLRQTREAYEMVGAS